MRKYTKRSICFIFVLVLFLSIVPPVSASTEGTHYLSIGLNAFFDSDGHNDLLERSDSAHLYFVEDMRETKMGTLAIKVLSFIYDIGVDESGTEPDEAKCAEVLVNIMKTYEMENAAEISKQHKMDNLKAVEDYALDIVDISAGYVQLLIGSSDDRLVTGIDKAISVLSATKDSTEDLIDILSDFETVTQSYVQFDSLLALVEENGHGSLKSAASALRNSMTQAMYCRLDMYADASQSVAGEFTECFFQNVFFDALKETDTYASNEAFGWFVDLGTNAINIYTPLHIGADIGKFVGNIAVGAEDIVNRTLEMKAIYDITQILEDELWFIYHTFTSNFTEETDAAAERYVILGNYLISCRIRGEYCLYSMLAKDSGLASRLDDETAIAAEKQYNRLTARMVDLKEALDGIPNVLVVDLGSEMPYEAVNMTSEWNVYGADGELYDNYTLRIYDKQSLLNFVHTGPVDEPDPAVTEYVVDSAEPLQITLEKGYAYTFEFVDNDDPNKIVLMTVGVTDNDTKLTTVLDIETHFGRFQLDSILNDNGLVFLTEEPYESHSELFNMREFLLTGDIYKNRNGRNTLRTMFPPEIGVIAHANTQKSSITVEIDVYEDFSMDLGEQMVLRIPGVIHLFRNDLSLKYDARTYYYIIENENADYLICESLSTSQTKSTKSNYYQETGSALLAELTEKIEIINMQNYGDYRSFHTEYYPDGDSVDLRFYECVGSILNDELLFSMEYPESGRFSNLADATEYIQSELSTYGLGDRVLENSSNLSGQTSLLISKVDTEPIAVSIDADNPTQLSGKLMIGGINGTIGGVASGSDYSSVSQIGLDDLIGTWYCSEIDKAYVFTSTGMDFSANLQSVDGSYVEMDLKNRDTEFGGFDLDNEDGAIVFHTIGSETFTISLQHKSLTIDGFSYQKVDSALQERIIGSWKAGNDSVRFDGDVCWFYVDGELEDHEQYYVLSDTILAVWSSGSYRKYEYEIDGNLLYYRYNTYKLSE